MYAVRAEANSEQLRIELANGVAVTAPIVSLGGPWTSANSRQFAHARMRMGGSWLWPDELKEGLVLGELLPTALRLNPAALLARQARGRRASSAKAAAARAKRSKGWVTAQTGRGGDLSSNK